MENTKNLSFWVIGGIAFVAIASLFYFSNGSETAAGTPAFQLDTEEIELGGIALQGDYPADFIVTNTGDAPLEISRVQTSCMCTFTEVLIGKGKSPEFNMDMHNSLAAKRWKGVVEPGQSAIVRVIYKPYLMPVQGSVARNVKFNTNDPANAVVELGIHATVQ